MGATGMTGAPNPKATGSSFYNATMAKTKIQEQNQKEELQKQLMKIFNDEGRNTIDQSEHISETTLGGQQQNAYQLPLDNTEEIENMSDINIAQSVGQSYEVNQFRGDNEQNQHWFQKINDTAGNNGVINEQEFESRSKEEDSMSKGNSNHKTELANTVRSNPQTIKHSEAIWDDPDLIPHVQNSGENQFADNFEVVQASQSLGKTHRTNEQSLKSKGRAIWEKPGTAAQPYMLDSQGESQFAYNIADTAGDEQSSIIASAYKANQFQLQGNGESNISNLNLLPAAGISLHEPQTAELI